MPPRAVAIAPATTGPESAIMQTEESQTMPHTCMTCSRRKVKCDKLTPVCTSCHKGRLECHYQALAPRKRKRKDDVHKRLEQYERLLKTNGIPTLGATSGDDALYRPSSPPHHPYGSAPRDTLSGNVSAELPDLSVRINEPETKRMGKLLAGNGKTRYIDSNLWRSLDDDAVHTSSEEEEMYSNGVNSASTLADPVSGALLSPSTPAMESLTSLHPPFQEAWKLWEIYVRHVEPIVKILHVPSGVQLMERATRDPTTISKANECLLFAIYHFASVAMRDEDHQQLRFSEPRASMVSNYQSALRQALVNASFLRTAEMPVLQAYVLFLLSVRNTYDQVTFWILTGVAVRIAQRMGLHRDGEAFRLAPFDVQIRRRVFWQLLPLDGLAGQLSGTGISIGPESWDTKRPLNVNDADLYPSMTEPPTERKGATDMMFCLARSAIVNFHLRTGHSTSSATEPSHLTDISAVDNLIDKLEATVEEKYLRYCDVVEPMHCLTLSMARGALHTSRLRIRLSKTRLKDCVTDNERAELCVLATKLLDYAISTYSNTVLARFSWHLQALFQWDTLICVLTGLKKPGVLSTSQAQAAWSKIEQLCGVYPEMLDYRRALQVAIGMLMLKAWDANPDGHRNFHEEPAFISALRSLRKTWSPTSAEGNADGTFPYDRGEQNAFAAIDPALMPSGPQQLGKIDIDFTGMDEINIENTEWLFWDQLIKEHESNPVQTT